MTSQQPNTTLYVNNISDKINKEELRTQLFSLFTTYGKLIDIVASKSQALRGQAFLVFTDLAGATSAMRACEGMVFYDKPLHIDYAKTKSYATSRREDPTFVAPTSANISAVALRNMITKRPRDDQAVAEDQPLAKRRDDKDDDDVEMELDDEDEPTESAPFPSATPVPTEVPTARLFCSNLPQEVTNDILSVLFQQYVGFERLQVAPSTPNAAGEKTKTCQAIFQSVELATTAREGLHNFQIKKGWPITAQFLA